MRKTACWRASLWAAAILCVASAGAAQEAKRPITFDDMMQMRRISGAEVSPDGKWVVYTVATPDMEANRNASNIWLVPTAGGDAIQLTRSGKDNSPAWSPNAFSWIALSAIVWPLSGSFAL